MHFKLMIIRKRKYTDNIEARKSLPHTTTFPKYSTDSLKFPKSTRITDKLESNKKLISIQSMLHKHILYLIINSYKQAVGLLKHKQCKEVQKGH